MIQPNDMKLDLPMSLSHGAISTTTQVWNILVASREGKPEEVKKLAEKCPELIYAQYNYTPPIHFAVREGHLELVKYLLENGAHDPNYKIYPFQESLESIAQDRGYHEISLLLEQYKKEPAKHRYKGDNGEIHYNRTTDQAIFQKTVYDGNFRRTEQILEQHPEFALDHSYFWGEGILTFPAKSNNRKLIELLMKYGATVPAILKWTQFYYFERYDAAVFMMEKGMNPNVMSWHHVTLLHDMAQKGYIDKAALLLNYGAEIDPIDEEFQSTPLGMAARWGHLEMVKLLLEKGADPNRSGADWSSPLIWVRKKGHHEIERLLLNAGSK